MWGFFIVTSAITLLGITNIIKIERNYLNKFFAALILEIVAIGVFGFKEFVLSESKIAYLRITSPVTNMVNTPDLIYVTGVALRTGDDQFIKCRMISNGDTTTLTTSEVPKERFTFTHSVSGLDFPAKVKFICTIEEGTKIVKADSVEITLTR